MRREHRLGAIVYDIEAGTIEARISEVPGQSPQRIGDVVNEVYPQRA